MSTPDDRSAPDIEGRLRSTLGAAAGTIDAEPIPVATIVHRSRRRRARTRTAGAVVGAGALVLVAGVVVRQRTDDVLTTTTDDPAPSSVATAPPDTVTVPVTTAPPGPGEAPTTISPTVTLTVPTTAAPSPTSPPTSTAPPTTVAPTPAQRGLILRGDGLGVAAFGQDADSAFAALTDVIGPPSWDSGWRPEYSGMESRPNRMVAWGGFWVTFIEDASGRYLAYWRYAATHEAFPREGGTPILETADGLALGQFYAEVVTIAGPGTPVLGEGATGLRVGVPSGNLYLWFDPYWSSEPTPAADSVVATIEAGDSRTHEP